MVWKRVTQRDLREGDIILLVVGLTGAGKSTFTNATLGSEFSPVGHSYHSKTSEVLSFAYDGPQGRVILVDTPGSDDSSKTALAIIERIANWIAALDQQRLQLSGVLFIHPLSVNRVSGATVTFLDNLESFFGNRKAKGRITLVGNLYGASREDASKRLEEFKKYFFTPFLDAGAHISTFDGTTTSARSIVDQLDYTRIVPNNTREMRKKGQFRDTKLGKRLYNPLAKLKEKMRRIIELIESLMRMRAGKEEVAAVSRSMEELKLAENRRQQLETDLIALPINESTNEAGFKLRENLVNFIRALKDKPTPVLYPSLDLVSGYMDALTDRGRVFTDKDVDTLNNLLSQAEKVIGNQTPIDTKPPFSPIRMTPPHRV